MNTAPRPVLTVRGTVCRIAVFTTRGKPQRALRAPQLAHPVEDHDRVVHRVADDGEQGGEEDAVDRLAQPGEHADEDQHVVRHRGDRGRAERPAEPDRQVGQLRQQRDAQRDQRLLPQLVAEARPDQLVALLGDLAAGGVVERRADLGLLVVGDARRSAPRCCPRRSPARRRAGSRRPTPPRGPRRPTARPSVEYSTSRPPVNSTPRSSPRTTMPATASSSDDERAGQPPPAVLHEVGVARRQPGADPARRRRCR